MGVFTCHTADVGGIVACGQLEVAAVLHLLVVSHAVVVGKVVSHVADAGVVGIDTVIYRDAGNLVVDVELHDASLAAADVARANLVRPGRDTRQTVGKVEGAFTDTQVGHILVKAVTRYQIRQTALVTKYLHVFAIAVGDEEARIRHECVPRRAVVETEVVVRQFRNQSTIVNADDVVEYIACHDVLIVDEQMVNEVDGAVKSLLQEARVVHGVSQHLRRIHDADVERDLLRRCLRRYGDIPRRREHRVARDLLRIVEEDGVAVVAPSAVLVHALDVTAARHHNLYHRALHRLVVLIAIRRTREVVLGFVGSRASLTNDVVAHQTGVEQVIVQQVIGHKLPKGVVLAVEVGVCGIGIPLPAHGIEVVDVPDAVGVEHAVGLAESGVAVVAVGGIGQRAAIHVGIRCPQVGILIGFVLVELQ